MLNSDSHLLITNHYQWIYEYKMSLIADSICLPASPQAAANRSATQLSRLAKNLKYEQNMSVNISVETTSARVICLVIIYTTPNFPLSAAS